jgi:hypothetical protein
MHWVPIKAGDFQEGLCSTEVGSGLKTGTLPLTSLIINILVYKDESYHSEFVLSSEAKGTLLQQSAFLLFI